MLSRRRFLQMCGVSLAAMAVGVPVVAAAGSIPVLLYHRIGDSDDKITAKTQRFVEDLDFLQKQGIAANGMWMWGDSIMPEIKGDTRGRVARNRRCADRPSIAPGLARYPS